MQFVSTIRADSFSEQQDLITGAAIVNLKAEEAKLRDGSWWSVAPKLHAINDKNGYRIDYFFDIKLCMLGYRSCCLEVLQATAAAE
jgi:hypothetical protein